MVTGKDSLWPPLVDSMLMVCVASGTTLLLFSEKSHAPVLSTAMVPITGPPSVGPLWMVMVLPGPGIVLVPRILQSPRVRNWACVMFSVSGATTFTVTVAALLTARWLSCTVYWKVTLPLLPGAGEKVIVPLVLGIASPLAGAETMVTVKGLSVSPASGSVSFPSTSMVTGVVTLAEAASSFAIGG